MMDAVTTKIAKVIAAIKMRIKFLNMGFEKSWSNAILVVVFI
jgi:hypothetical protein